MRGGCIVNLGLKMARDTIVFNDYDSNNLDAMENDHEIYVDLSTVIPQAAMNRNTSVSQIKPKIRNNMEIYR